MRYAVIVTEWYKKAHPKIFSFLLYHSTFFLSKKCFVVILISLWLHFYVFNIC